MSGLGFRLCTNASNLLKFKELESDLILRKIIKKSFVSILVKN